MVICFPTIYLKRWELVQHVAVRSRSIWKLFGNVALRSGEKTRVSREKPLGAEKRTNNKPLNPNMTPDPGIEPRSHQWETSALITAPTLLLRHFHTSHFFRPTVLHEHWMPLKKSEKMVMQNFGRQTKYIMGHVEVVMIKLKLQSDSMYSLCAIIGESRDQQVKLSRSKKNNSSQREL